MFYGRAEADQYVAAVEGVVRSQHVNLPGQTVDGNRATVLVLSLVSGGVISPICQGVVQILV